VKLIRLTGRRSFFETLRADGTVLGKVLLRFVGTRFLPHGKWEAKQVCEIDHVDGATKFF
jgi:hypothetical protein